jgi:hypothetical protein
MDDKNPSIYYISDPTEPCTTLATEKALLTAAVRVFIYKRHFPKMKMLHRESRERTHQNSSPQGLCHRKKNEASSSPRASAAFQNKKKPFLFEQYSPNRMQLRPKPAGARLAPLCALSARAASRGVTGRDCDSDFPIPARPPGASRLRATVTSSGWQSSRRACRVGLLIHSTRGSRHWQPPADSDGEPERLRGASTGRPLFKLAGRRCAGASRREGDSERRRRRAAAIRGRGPRAPRGSRRGFAAVRAAEARRARARRNLAPTRRPGMSR